MVDRLIEQSVFGFGGFVRELGDLIARECGACSGNKYTICTTVF